MNANRLKQIWENGVSLSDAFDHFADENAIQFRDHSIGLDAKFQGTEAENLKQIFKAASVLGRTLIDIASDKLKQRDWVFSQLNNKNLMAIGCKAGGNNSIEIAIVPESLLNSDFVQWAQSSISGLNLEFVDVRICRYRQINFARNAAKPIGRPNSRGAVWDIIEALGFDELDSRHCSNKTAIAQEIHEFGINQFPEKFTKAKPTVQTIIRHLNSYSEQKIEIK